MPVYYRPLRSSAASAAGSTVSEVLGKEIINPEGIEQSGEDHIMQDRDNFAASANRGARSTQEDRFVGFTDHRLNTLSEAEVKILLESIVAELQENERIQALGRGRSPQGSCALLTATLPAQHKVVTANLGDSTTFVLIQGREGEKHSMHRVNEHLHNASLERERLYIEEHGGKVSANGRVFAALAVTAAIGDNAYDHVFDSASSEPIVKDILRRQPEVDVHTVTIPEGGKATVITACDGLTEAKTFAEEDVADFFIEHRLDNLELNEAAYVLAQEAIARGSKDNVSTCVVPFSPKERQAVFTVIYDGHAGEGVSQICADETRALFEKHLDGILRKRQQQSSGAAASATAVSPIITMPSTLQPQALAGTPIVEVRQVCEALRKHVDAYDFKFSRSTFRRKDILTHDRIKKKIPPRIYDAVYQYLLEMDSSEVDYRAIMSKVVSAIAKNLVVVRGEHYGADDHAKAKRDFFEELNDFTALYNKFFLPTQDNSAIMASTAAAPYATHFQTDPSQVGRPRSMAFRASAGAILEETDAAAAAQPRDHFAALFEAGAAARRKG